MAWAGTYKVAASVIDKLIPTVSNANGASYVNRMFAVHYTDGIIDGVVGPYVSSNEGASLAQVTGVYKDATLIFSPAGTKVTWDGQVLALADAPYAQINVVGLNPLSVSSRRHSYR